MLKSAPAEKSIPEAAFHTVMRMATKQKEKGAKPSLEAIYAGTIFATAEMAEIGNAGGFFEQPLGKDNIQPVLQASLERMVVEGVKRKLIDPVEFQQKIEPMLNDQQRAAGTAMAERGGVPMKPGAEQAMEQYATQAVDKERAMIANKQSAQNRQGMMQQAAQGGQPQ